MTNPEPDLHHPIMRRSAATISALLLLCGACGSETETTPRELDATDQFASDLAAVMCTGIRPCCEESGLDAPVEFCPTTMRNHTMEAILVAKEEKREAKLEGADTALCLQTFREAIETAETCGALPHPRSLTQLCPELFAAIPDGDKAPGEPCEFTYECSAPPDEGSVRQCYRRDLNTISRCTWFLPTAPGEPCEDESGKVFVCDTGLGCGEDVETGELVCGEAPDYGEACSLSSRCTPGLTCVASLQNEGATVCVDVIALDHPCLQEPDACAEDLFCDLESDRCIPMPVNVACDGEPCPAVNLQATCR